MFKNLRIGNKQMEIEQSEGQLITIRVGSKEEPKVCIQIHKDMFHEYVQLFQEAERLFGLQPKQSAPPSYDEWIKKVFPHTNPPYIHKTQITCNSDPDTRTGTI